MEKLIEELTKVNPSNLSEEGLKLFNKINEIIDRNKELFETCCRYEDTLEHYEYKIFDELDDYIKLDEISKLDKIGIKGKKYISESLIKEKIEELNKPTEIEKKYHWYKDIRLGKIQILEELLGEEK